jgi:hypothetical protein
MQHYDLGDGVRVGIGHTNFDSEDSTESSEFSISHGQGFNTGLGQSQGFNSGQGFNTGFGQGVNAGLGQGVNAGFSPSVNAGLGQGFNIDRSGEIKCEQFDVVSNCNSINTSSTSENPVPATNQRLPRKRAYPPCWKAHRQSLGTGFVPGKQTFQILNRPILGPRAHFSCK